ncbi:helix-turn-helix domain-containing protein [Burkholderia glumae]|uniref:helix-turn-helix domain-containing protein n=1 Tax=Burkholderia glumae TaxID=337 RepID=UPI003BF5C31D
MTAHVFDSLGLGAAISLTERERQVLRWTVEGLNAFDISEKLNISVSTVNWQSVKCLPSLAPPIKYRRQRERSLSIALTYAGAAKTRHFTSRPDPGN